MGIVAFIRFILVVRERNGNAALFLFGRGVDLADVLHLDGLSCKIERMQDGRRQRRFAVVNVADRSNVDVRLCPFKFCCHVFII